MGGIGEHHVSGILAAMVGSKSYDPVSVVASNVSRSRSGPQPTGSVTSIALPNTTITGGVAPYTQAWTRQSGDTPTISDANALNPTWSATVSFDTPNVSTWRVTATDAVGATAFFDIEVTLVWTQT